MTKDPAPAKGTLTTVHTRTLSLCPAAPIAPILNTPTKLAKPSCREGLRCKLWSRRRARFANPCRPGNRIGS